MKTLVTVAFVIDVDDFGELSTVVQAMEEASSTQMREALARNGVTFREFSEAFQYYGVSASPARETIAE